SESSVTPMTAWLMQMDSVRAAERGPQHPSRCHPRESGGPGPQARRSPWTPAFAGVTGRGAVSPRALSLLAVHQLLQPRDVLRPRAAAAADDGGAGLQPFLGMDGVVVRVEIVARRQQPVGRLAAVERPVLRHRLEGVGIAAGDALLQ